VLLKLGLHSTPHLCSERLRVASRQATNERISELERQGFARLPALCPLPIRTRKGLISALK